MNPFCTPAATSPRPTSQPCCDALNSGACRRAVRPSWRFGVAKVDFASGSKTRRNEELGSDTKIREADEEGASRISRHGKSMILMSDPKNDSPKTIEMPTRFLESVRKHQAGLHSFRNMKRIDASRKNARPLRLRHSQSLASLRHRLSHANVRSTTQRLGRTTKPFC